MSQVTETFVQSNAYSPATIISADLNGLANGSLCLGSNVLINTLSGTSSAGNIALGGLPLADIRFNWGVPGGTFTANTGITIWLLSLLDGTTLESYSTSAAPNKSPAVVIGVDAVGTAGVRDEVIELIPGKFKMLVQNNTGQQLNGSLNTIQMTTFGSQAG